MTDQIENPSERGPESTSEMIQQVQQTGVIPDDLRVRDAVAAVLCTLVQRLPRRDVDRLALALPEGMRTLVAHCPRHQGEAEQRFSGDQFIQYVAAHLDIGTGLAESITRAVFAVVQASVPPAELSNVESSLPQDLASIWRDPRAGLRELRSEPPSL